MEIKDIMIDTETDPLSDEFSFSNIESLVEFENDQNYFISDNRINYDINRNDSKINKITEAFENMLGTKQIINKESNMLILRPYFCYQILSQLKNIKSPNTKLEIIEKLSWLINKIHSNAFIITNKSILNDSNMETNVNFMNELIDILIENNREEIISEKILNFIEKVIFLSGLKVIYLKHIFEKISDLFDSSKYDGNKFLLFLKLLNVS